MLLCDERMLLPEDYGMLWYAATPCAVLSERMLLPDDARANQQGHRPGPAPLSLRAPTPCPIKKVRYRPTRTGLRAGTSGGEDLRKRPPASEQTEGKSRYLHAHGSRMQCPVLSARAARCYRPTRPLRDARY
eukprot:3085380-Rhodomonas_salina.2